MPRFTSEQLEAINRSGENIIVSAGAGSGKTAVLTERVIEKLRNGVHIDELLVLTFTKAAAAEMKERIRVSIKKNDSIKDELLKLDQAYITTFDSFLLSVLKKYYYVLGLDSNLGITEESILVTNKEKIMDEVFDSLYEIEDKDFLELISNFCVKDDKSLRSSVFNMAKKLEQKLEVNSFLNTYVDSYYSEEVMSKFSCEYQELIEEKKQEIRTIENELGFYVDGDYKDKVSDFLKPIYEESDIVKLKSLLSLRFPSLPRGSEDDVKTKKESLVKVLKEFSEMLKYGSEDEMKMRVFSTRKSACVIISILKKYFERVNEFKRINNMYEFNDIAFMVIKILKENENVREEVKNSFKEILVDEYQDTNDIQEEFISLISDNNVYMVGDVKQSIYRFRNANPYIFRNKYNDYSNHKGGIKMDLLKNFRSRDEVLQDINVIFRQVMDDKLGGADYVLSHQMVFGNLSYNSEGATSQNNYSEVWQIPSMKEFGFSEDEIEAFLVARDIKKKVKEGYKVFDKKGILRDIKYSDMVILMDRSTQFDLYKKIFEDQGVPLTLYKDESLESSEDFRLVKRIVDFIVSLKLKDYGFKFRYSFVSIARSFLYSIKDDEIYKCVHDGKIFQSKVYENLKVFVSKLDTSDIYHLLSDIFDELDFYGKGIRRGDVKNRNSRLLKILELGKSMDESGYDVYEFSEYLEDLMSGGHSIKYSVSSGDEDSVKIMTIHKSKGLEYPVCYFTGLFKSFNIMEIKDRFVFDDSYGFVLPYFDEGIGETFVKLLMKEKYVRDEVSEKIRLFYVALTRAREKMIFLLPSKEVLSGSEALVSFSKRVKFRSFADIMYSLKGSILDRFRVLELNHEDFSKTYMFPKDVNKVLFSSDRAVNVSEFECNSNIEVNKHFSKSVSSVVSKEDARNMEFGTKVHEVLEFFDFKNPNYDGIHDKFILDRVKVLMDSDIFRNVKNANIYKEHEFMFLKDGVSYHGIIDLILEYDDHVDIVDYKLKNTSDEGYLAQLDGYKKYVESVSGKVVNTYLYSIIDAEVVKVNVNEEVR